MKKLVTFLSLFVITAVTFGLDIARDKKAQCVIAVAGKQSEFEKIATDELKLFLEKMSGARFTVIPEAEVQKNRNVIYLGQTQYAKNNGINFSRLDKEEWVLKTTGNNLIISGGRPVGTLYGVYDLLERLGVYFLTMDQNVIPQKNELNIQTLNIKSKPRFAGRNIYDAIPQFNRIAKIPPEKQKAYWMFHLRSRFNGPQDSDKPLYMGDLFNLTFNYHSFCYYVDPNKYFKSHPEYFSMNEKGKRFKPGSKRSKGGLCLSNKEVWRVTLDSLRNFIKRDRAKMPKEKWPVVYDISTLDNSPYVCKCPACMEICKIEGGDSGLVMRYINYIAIEIAKEYPEMKIRTFAYSSTKDVPKVTMPVSNVIIQYCDDFPNSDCYRPLKSAFNKKYLNEIKKWHKTGARLVIWDYWNMGGPFFNPPRVETMIDAIQSDLKTFAELGAVALFIEAEKDPVTPQNFINLCYFLGAQLMVDPNKNIEPLIKIFMENYYGSASAEMTKYLNAIRDGVKKHPKRQRTGCIGKWNYMTPQFALNSYKLLRKAAARTPENSICQQRVHDEMIPLLWQILNSKNSYQKIFMESGFSMDKLTAECRQYCIEHINKFSPEAPQRYLKKFNDRFKLLSVNLPRPDKFKNVKEENIRVFGYPQFRPKPKHSCIIVEDADSPSGKALKSFKQDPNLHGSKKVFRNIRITYFAINNRVTNKNLRGIHIKSIPQDERYHWYKIRNVEIGSNTILWGHMWIMVVDLSQAYMVGDGVSGINKWDVWFSAKFIGPEYVKGSQKENAIFIDMVVLVRPR